MTRLAVLADIHGNLTALDAVIADMAAYDVDHVIVAGDAVNWGPESAAVVARIVAAGWGVIRGNNEYYLLDYQTDREPEAWRDYEMTPYLYRHLAGRWHHTIAAWPDTISLRYPDAPPVRVWHGSPRSPSEGIFPGTPESAICEMLDGTVETTVIAAHTHLALERQAGRWRVLNPGSVGAPMDGRDGACYLLLDARDGDWHATFRRIEYDTAPLFAAFERERFVEECGVTGHLVVQEFKTARLHVLPFMQWRAAEHPGAPLSMALVAQFTDADRWAHTPRPYHVNRDSEAPTAPC
jgi:predicted phosphodiesterase